VITNKQALIARNKLYQIGKMVKDTVTAKRVFNIRRELDEVFKFVCERQDAMAEAAGVTADEKGSWIYPDAETKEKFDKENTELLEADSGVEPITVKAESIPGLSVEDIAALAGVVEIEVGGEE